VEGRPEGRMGAVAGGLRAARPGTGECYHSAQTHTTVFQFTCEAGQEWCPDDGFF